MKKIFLIILIFCLFEACTTKTAIVPSPSTLNIIGNSEEQQKLMLAFAKAYPGQITSVEFINDDWTMLVNGRRFYFANGRFLPENLRNKWEDYIPWDFYEYPWTGTEEERQAVYKNPVYSIGSSFLFDTLYASSSEDASWDLQEKYSFLGVKMLIHPIIKPKLDKIASLIRAEALSDPSIEEWIEELQTSPPAFGWNWRSIVGTNRRSNHSYGTALDLLPRNLRGRATYWRWESRKSKKLIYYLPPEKVIEIFEDHGFIWGGKWDLIDTMHFEYRPEILLLNNHEIIY